MNLEEHVNFRLFPDRRSLVRKFVRHNKGAFESENHFYRCAVEHFLRYCQQKGLKTKK